MNEQQEARLYMMLGRLYAQTYDLDEVSKNLQKQNKILAQKVEELSVSEIPSLDKDE